MNLSQAQKRRLYAAGKYRFKAPGVYTGNWTDNDWIAHVSEWLPTLEIVIYPEGNGHHWAIAGEAMAPDEIRHEDFLHSESSRAAAYNEIFDRIHTDSGRERVVATLDRLWNRRPLPAGFGLYKSDHGNGWQWVYVATDGPTAGQIFYRLEAEETDWYQEVDDAIAAAWEHTRDPKRMPRLRSEGWMLFPQERPVEDRKLTVMIRDIERPGRSIRCRNTGIAILSDGRKIDSNHEIWWKYAGDNA